MALALLADALLRLSTKFQDCGLPRGRGPIISVPARRSRHPRLTDRRPTGLEFSMELMDRVDEDIPR